jgi:hypothetical protein
VRRRRDLECVEGGVPGADSGGPSAWRGARASAGQWMTDFGRPAAAENLVGQRTGGTAEGGYCDNPPRKIPYYRLRLIHFGH